jgi:hypothetical protein
VRGQDQGEVEDGVLGPNTPPGRTAAQKLMGARALPLMALVLA